MRFRERKIDQTDVGALVVQVDPASPATTRTPIGRAFFFYGTGQVRTTPDLSFQWLSELVMADSITEATQIAADAATARDQQTTAGQLLSLQTAYMCSAVGRDMRIVTKDFDATSLAQTWSYAIVDEDDFGPDEPMVVSEIWVAQCPSSEGGCNLTPASLAGADLVGRDAPVDWQLIAERVRDHI